MLLYTVFGFFRLEPFYFSLYARKQGQRIYVLLMYLYIRVGENLAKPHKSFRFDPKVFDNFRELALKNGYTATAALEKFMTLAVEHGLMFPAAVKTENVEAEARIMLAWLKEGRYWV